MGNSNENSKINDLIFKELIKRGYSLDGDKKIWNIADSKLAYLTPAQAQGFLDYQDSETYTSEFGPKEAKLLRKNIDEIIKTTKSNYLNIIDLGCADGRKAVKIIKEYISTGCKVRYCPIDISGHMVKKAIQNISEIDVEEVIESKWNISDFDNLENIIPLLNIGNYQNNVFLLLGNTLSNFDFHELLYQIRRSMKTGDYLIIGNGINNNQVEEDVINYCKNNEAWKSFLLNMPLHLGLDAEKVSFDARFVNSRIEFFYHIKEDQTITFQDKEITFKKNDIIIVYISYHYTKADFISFLNLYFDKNEIFLSEEDSYALALCKK